MDIQILAFGQIAEITGNEHFSIAANDTDELKRILEEKYPALSTMKYILAVNKQMVDGNTVLTLNATVALMPPFSGG